MNWRVVVSIAFVALIVINAHADTNPVVRRAAVKIEKSGLPNFHRISDRLYRSAQPTEEGFKELRRAGFKTVVNLRAFHTESKPLSVFGIKQEHIFFKTWHPEEEDIVRFLKLVTATNTAPVLVHCQHGADRTGTMIAIYRIAVEGWSKQDAIKEMTGEQFGFHRFWGNLLRFINDLDIDAIKAKAGITSAIHSKSGN